MRQVSKWHTLADGTKCAKWLGNGDVRGFRPVPDGYGCKADLVEIHPVTGKRMKNSEWWIFLTPER